MSAPNGMPRGTKRSTSATQSYDDQTGPGGSLTSKRVRFGATADDGPDALEEDLELPKRSTGVRLDGFGSDSDNEDYARPSAAAEADEDEDMFSSAPSAPAAGKGKGKGKDDTDKIVDSGLALKGSTDREFLELGDIEGQEFAAPRELASESEEEEFESGDEFANTDDAPRSRRTKKGMGYVLSGFNMKDEMDEGKFDTEGTYITNSKDPHAVHDVWMNDFNSKKAIKAAARAKAVRDSAAVALTAADAKKSRPQCLKELVESGLLRKDNEETIMGALKRLGDQKKQIVKNRPKKARKGQAMEVDDSNTHADEVKEVTRQIDQLTSLASTLLDVFNETDVYEETYDSVVKTLRLEGEVPRGWEPAIATQQPAPVIEEEPTTSSSSLIARPLINRSRPIAPSQPINNTSYKYKWKPNAAVPADQIGKSFGPFSSAEMVQWVAGGFFGVDGGNIEVEESGKEGVWRSWS